MSAQDAFRQRGLESAWERVVGLVVQPGIEFGDEQVFGYQREKAGGLSQKIANYGHLVYEAHSTDYQNVQQLQDLVEDHFCLLKTGPWLTFAYREALFALENMETEFLKGGGIALSNLQATLETVMLENDRYWKKYYHGSAAEQFFKRKYSFSDRSRYYWSNQRINDSVTLLLTNLNRYPVPLSLLSEFMPNQFRAVMEGQLELKPAQLVLHKIKEALEIYARACGFPPVK